MLTSVIVPTFNQNPAFLRAAIASVMAQDTAVQLVVVDDGSVPTQQAICEAAIDGHPNAKESVYIYQVNAGVAAALNAGIKQAKGEYIQWLSSDDLLFPSRSRVQIAAMQEAQSLVSYCGYEDGIPQVINTYPAAQYPSQEALFNALRRQCFINACTVIWHRDVFEQVGYFDTRLRHAQDYGFLLACAEKFNFLAVNELLVRRRPHAGQMSQTLHDPAELGTKQNDLQILRERFGTSAGVYVPPVLG